MKKIKLPLEMANGVMVTKSLEELKENWDLEKIVEHFVTGKLITWLNDRYYTDLAEKVENLPKDGDSRKLQQALCRVFEMPCEELELDVDEIAERKRRQDLLRQFTSDDEILKNVDKVAFDQEDLAYLLDDEIAEIYLFNNKFTIPLNVEGKKYIGIGDNVVAEIRSKKPVNFAERGIAFSNVKFDEKYATIHEVVPEKPKFSAKVGDIIKLGEWGGEEIEWLVINRKEGRLTLLSKYIIDSRPYDFKYRKGVTWETSTIRSWLNSDFFDDAFTDNEKKIVMVSDVRAHVVSRFPNRPQGNNTCDRVYLLSVEECERYWDLEDVRLSIPTRFAVQRGVHVDRGTGTTAWWWLRSRGEPSEDCTVRSSCVIDYGNGNGNEIGEVGDCTNVSYQGIRPVIQVDIEGIQNL